MAKQGEENHVTCSNHKLIVNSLLKTAENLSHIRTSFLSESSVRSITSLWSEYQCGIDRLKVIVWILQHEYYGKIATHHYD